MGEENCTGEAERSGGCLQIELGDYKLWSYYQRCDIITLEQRFTLGILKCYLFPLNKLISILNIIALVDLCSYNRIRKTHILAKRNFCFICSWSSPFCQNTFDKNKQKTKTKRTHIQQNKQINKILKPTEVQQCPMCHS